MTPSVKQEAKQLGVILTLALFVAGCVFHTTSDQEGCDAAQTEQELQALRVEIETEIGEAEASSIEACRALPLGAKPCGGPWTYLVYSAETSDPTRLDALAEEYRQLDAERNQACGLASDCSLVGAPPLVVRSGRCMSGE